jgi:hypothetical protein
MTNSGGERRTGAEIQLGLTPARTIFEQHEVVARVAVHVSCDQPTHGPGGIRRERARHGDERTRAGHEGVGQIVGVDRDDLGRAAPGRAAVAQDGDIAEAAANGRREARGCIHVGPDPGGREQTDSGRLQRATRGRRHDEQVARTPVGGRDRHHAHDVAHRQNRHRREQLAEPRCAIVAVDDATAPRRVRHQVWLAIQIEVDDSGRQPGVRSRADGDTNGLGVEPGRKTAVTEQDAIAQCGLALDRATDDRIQIPVAIQVDDGQTGTRPRVER